ncbi:AraC family transcriptional regulator [Larkinella soli]|uniref:AraC family transcriptional regulator n=1 Tax=Larkinella soli TaxID=1770527 RepID=UPI000FFC0DA6|nr:helix-turn-helix domain-containing protein [Larkinella soli]
MNVVVREPAPSLRLFVDKLWLISADSFVQQDIGLPVLQHEFMFSFSDHFSVYDHRKQPLVRDREGWVTPIYTRPMRTVTMGRHESFGVFLLPWALQPLTGIPAFELTDRVLEIDALFGKAASELVGRLREASEPVQKLAVLERFLKKRLESRDVPAYLAFAVEYLQNRPWHDGMVKELSNHLGISQKSLTAAFRKYVGLSPGRFLHLRLFNQVTADLARNPRQSLTGLAYRHRFFDQAHLNHHFKSLSGLTPGQYRDQVLAGNIDPQDPCYIRAGLETYTPNR